MTRQTIYLDHAATTPLDPQVLEVMLLYFTEWHGNPSSIHRVGREALRALDDAREIVASCLHAQPREIIFTGSGSESNNTAIKGVALAQQQRGKGSHIITSAIEHHAVLHAVEYLQQYGFEITLLPVDRQGVVAPDDLRAALRPDTVLVSVMYANNEIGTIQPITQLAAVCHEHGIPIHTDAVQAAGALPLDVDALQVDLLTLTAHKFYGPKGSGLLYVRRGTPLLPQINGGSQERGRRAGTENVPGIVGLAAALRLAEERRTWYAEHCMTLRDQLIEKVLRRIPGAHLNGEHTHRLPNNANLCFDGVDSESLLLLLDQHSICVSSGSACTSGALDPSHVLLALGLSHEQASSSLRFTVGKDVTYDDIAQVVDVLPGIVAQVRGEASSACP